MLSKNTESFKSLPQSVQLDKKFKKSSGEKNFLQKNINAIKNLDIKKKTDI